MHNFNYIIFYLYIIKYFNLIVNKYFNFIKNHINKFIFYIYI